MAESSHPSTKSIIEDFFRKSGLPRDVVPTSDQVNRAVNSGRVFLVDTNFRAYAGKPARVVLYNDLGNACSGRFQDPELKHFIWKEVNLRTVPDTWHPGLGVLAAIASTDNPRYQVCYFLKESP